MGILNTDLMRHPANWVIVTLMVVLGGLAMQFVLAAATTATASPSDA